MCIRDRNSVLYVCVCVCVCARALARSLAHITFKQETGYVSVAFEKDFAQPGTTYYSVIIVYYLCIVPVPYYTHFTIALVKHCHYSKIFQAKMHMSIQVVNNSLTSKQLTKCSE